MREATMPMTPGAIFRKKGPCRGSRACRSPNWAGLIDGLVGDLALDGLPLAILPFPDRRRSRWRGVRRAGEEFDGEGGVAHSAAGVEARARRKPAW